MSLKLILEIVFKFESLKYVLFNRAISLPKAVRSDPSTVSFSIFLNPVSGDDANSANMDALETLPFNPMDVPNLSDGLTIEIEENGSIS